MRVNLATVRGLAIQTAVLVFVLLVHESFRTQYARLHILVVPALVIPVAYYSSVLGARGAALAAVLSALIILDHANDIHPLHLVMEIGLIGSISLLGAAVAMLANRDKAIEARVTEESEERLNSLAEAPGYWDRVSLTKVGVYVTRIESEFIARALESGPPGVTADIGAGSGRLHAVIAPRSSAVLATEVSRDELSAMKADAKVAGLLVSPFQGSLPFRTGSLRNVIAMEVPAVSDEAWFRDECRRVLDPGGTVIITVHNAISYKGLVSRLLRYVRARRGQPWAGLYYRSGLGAHVEAWRTAGFGVRSSRGFYWIPLSRASNSTWITAAAAIERMLGLRWLTGWSPWVLLELQKERAPG